MLSGKPAIGECVEGGRGGVSRATGEGVQSGEVGGEGVQSGVVGGEGVQSGVVGGEGVQGGIPSRRCHPLRA